MTPEDDDDEEDVDSLRLILTLQYENWVVRDKGCRIRLPAIRTTQFSYCSVSVERKKVIHTREANVAPGFQPRAGICFLLPISRHHSLSMRSMAYPC
eukprot:scaffold13572_cov56-Attheya_sp.AAC.4